MGIFSKAQSVSAYQASGNINLPGGLFTPSTIPLALFPDIDTSEFPVTIAEAMRVPGVVRAVQLYSTLGSRLPLEGAPFLTHRVNGATTPALTVASVVQDLILVGAAVLTVTRDGAGTITNALRVHPARWAVTPEGHVSIDGVVQPDDSVVYVPSLLPMGFLEYGRDSVRHYSNLARTINNRSAVPQPATILQPTTDYSGTDAEIDTAIDNLADVLAHGRGGLVYLPYGLDLSGFGGADSASQMLIEARDAVRTDLANHLGISASLLDGTRSGSAETYSNSLQQSNELLELSLKTWTEPIADRLSQDDVTPAGVQVKFDYSGFDAANAAGNILAPREQNILKDDNAD